MYNPPICEDGDELVCSGCNFFGQLGIGMSRRADPPYIPVSFGVGDGKVRGSQGPRKLDPLEVADIQCGTQFSCLLKTNGGIEMCGTMNGAVFPSFTTVELKHPLKCVQIACGRKHILALMEGGYVFSWGTGYLGQLGLGDDCSWDSPRLIKSLDPAKLGGDMVGKVVCGGSHSGVLTARGRKCYMWGLNRNGQTGTNVKAESVLEPHAMEMGELGKRVTKDIVCGRNHTVVVTNCGRVYACGAAGFGRLGLMDGRKKQMILQEITHFRANPVDEVAAGDFHTLAKCREGNVYSWGYCLEGQCGNGATMNIRTPRKVDFPEEVDIDGLVCGSSWSFTTTSNGEIYTWGYGDGGWMCVQPSYDLPYIESDSPPVASMNGEYYENVHTRSFDSTLNVLRPALVDVPADRYVKWVRCGGGHTVMCLSPVEDMGEQDEDAAIEWNAQETGNSGVSSTGLTPRQEAKLSDADLTVGAGSFGMKSQHASEYGTNGRTPRSRVLDIFLLVRHKKVPELHHVMADSEFNIECRDENGNTPLIVAAQNGHTAVARLLIEKGADPNAVNNKQNASLHYSISYGFADMTRFLIASGADEFATNLEGMTCYEGLTREDLDKL